MIKFELGLFLLENSKCFQLNKKRKEKKLEKEEEDLP
jgi:hypothetical protein